MTAPLTPPDCDLRDFRFMPLDVVRLSQSDMIATATSGAVVADLLLWCAAWHQVPAGSLPNDDRVLSNLAGFGRVVSAWQGVRDEVLERWVLCSDGRLYHPVVAEKAREAFKGKLAQRHRSFLAAVRKHNERNPDDKREGLSYEAWEAIGRPKEVAPAAPKALPAPQLDLLDDQDVAPSRVTQDEVACDNGGSSDVTPPEKSRDSGSKGEGEGEGEGQGQLNPPLPTDAGAKSGEGEEELILSREDLLTITNRLARLGGVALRPERIGAFTREVDLVKAWLKDRIDVDKTIIPAIARRLAATDDTVGSLKFYDRDVRRDHAKALAQANGSTAKASTPSGPARQWPALREPDTDDDRVVTIRKRLRDRAGGKLYDQWLDPQQTSLRLDEGVLLVTTRAPFTAQWLGSSLIDTLRAVANDVLGQPEVKVEAQR